MFSQGGIVVKIDQLLISSSMLTAISTKIKADNLKLLEPFVLVCVNELVDIGDEIPKRRVIEKLDQEYAISSMPEAVLDKILSRLAQAREKYISYYEDDGKKKNRFMLNIKPDEQVKNFEMQKRRAETDSAEIVASLVKWLDNKKIGYHPTENDVRNALGRFFESNGYDILFDLNEIRGTNSKQADFVNYQIGLFVLDLERNNPKLFSKMKAISQGMMLASVIYVDTTTVSTRLKKQRLSDVEVYLDTPLLLYALNFKTDSQKERMDALLDLLRENGAKICTFEQHVFEVKEILNAYKSSPMNNWRTLEGIEKRGYSSIEIDSIIRRLDAKLKDLDINILSNANIVNSDGTLLPNKNVYIDYTGLQNKLISKIPSYKKRPYMLHNDMGAINSIMIKRAGSSYTEIESCGAIFVTSNYDLIRTSNSFLGYKSSSQYITPLISDVDITSILWIKYGMSMQRHDISKLNLIELARSAFEPTESMIQEFGAVTKRMIDEGKLSEDEAANIRFSAYARTEIITLCGGDSDALNADIVLSVRDKIKAQYASEEMRKAREAAARTNEIANRIEKEIEVKYEKAYNKIEYLTGFISKAVSFFISVLLISLAGFSAVGTFKKGFSWDNSWPEFFLLIISALSMAFFWCPFFKQSHRLRTWYHNKISNIVHDHYLKKVTPEINRLKSLLEDDTTK